MADVRSKVIKAGVEILSVNEFRTKHAEGVTSQAIKYAIVHDLIDYIPLDDRINIIVMTEKTKNYKPNPHSKRVG